MTVKTDWDMITAENPLHIKLEKMASYLTNWAKRKLSVLPKEISKVKGKLNILLNAENKPFRAQEIASLECKLEKLLNQEETH